MPINSQHREYKEWAPEWEKCRDAVAGAHAIKKKGKQYLPELPGHRDRPEDYKDYLQRTLFLGASGRTVQGLSGAVFRKAPVMEAPSNTAVAAVLDDVTGTGVAWERQAQDVLDEVLTTGRVALYVTHTQEEPVEGGRPFVTMIRPEEIINWKVGNLNGKTQLLWVVLREMEEEVEDDPYAPKEVEQYRLLRLDGENGTQVFTVDIYRENKDALNDEERWVLVDSIVPKRRSRPLDYIPLYFCGPTNTEPSVEKPPVLDLVDANLNHYQQNADYRNVLFFCAAGCTAWVAGFDTDKELRLGGSTAWVTSNEDAKVGFLEFTGQGAQPLVDSLEKLEHYMAYMGSRLLAQPKKAVEAAETHRLRTSAEQVTVQSIAQTVGQVLGEAYSDLAGWVTGTPNTITVALNTDLSEAMLDAPMLTALVAALQGGAISSETFLWNLQRGEMLEPGVTVEDERRRIEIQAPSSPDAGEVARAILDTPISA